MAAASGVTQAAAGKGLRDSRIIPLAPMHGDVEILYGDPAAPGQPFVMRIRELPGSVVPPHSHPVDEHITVVQGTWHFGLGDAFDPSRTEGLKAGAYAFAPKGSSMFAFSPAGAIVQVHGVGPFLIHWHGGLHTLDDPDASTVFDFAKAASVETPRGPGRIVQGYASGDIVQYELEAPDGTRFMADQAAVRAR
ncbi:MAG TPA: cupin domain-containing protein [Candidatus Saccharimonadia bacterium]|nr:cupin domain-containing protein [Candidatus Saccharimonadia bacterium]